MGIDNPAWNSQTQTARENASQEGDTISSTASATISAGGSETLTVFDNTTGESVVLELVTLRENGGFNDNVGVTVVAGEDILDDKLQAAMNIIHFPLVLDPGIRVLSDEEVFVVVSNNTSSERSYDATAVLREV